MSEIITWFYSGGDAFMAQLKLIVVLMFLDFVLCMMSLISDGMRSV